MSDPPGLPGPALPTPEEALAAMTAVRDGGIVDWLQRLPGVVVEPGRRTFLGGGEPDVVTLGPWRVSAVPGGVLARLVSAGIVVRTREETGLAAGTLLLDIVQQHAGDLAPVQRDQLAVELGALQEVTAASSRGW